MRNANDTLIHGGIEGFSHGTFEDGGTNLYVNANGVIETIHRTDVNNDGYVDIVLPNSHGYIERGPTWIYRPHPGNGKDWERQELPNDSSWMSRIVDLDGDGYPDLVVVNGENGVTSELTSYVYWGGPDGLTGERAELPTAGAYDVAIVDVDHDGQLDLIFPSAWVDHHNPGRPRHMTVYRQTTPRQFEDASKRYGLIGVAVSSVACGDLNGNGLPDLVVANYRNLFEYDTESFVYWGTDDGFDTDSPLRLPTHYALQALLADLNGNGRDEIIFCGGGQCMIYWNDNGSFSPDNRTIIEAAGFGTMFSVGAIRAAVADVDGDGANELILATEDGLQIRPGNGVETVQTFLPLPYATWVSAADLDGDGRPELIASKYDDRVTYETESAIFWNGPDGFSADRVSRVPTCGAMGNTAGDLDGDGRPEVVFNNTMRGPSQWWSEMPVYVYLGSPNADYGVHRRLDLPSDCGTDTCIIADLNHDGYNDLAMTSGSGLRIFHGGPDGLAPDRYSDLPVRGDTLMTIHVADFNRDGWLDLFAGVQTYDTKPETYARSTQIFWGSPDGFSPERSDILPTYGGGQVHLADVNRDGWIDILMGDKRGYINVFLGGPDGFSPERIMKIPLNVTSHIGSINSADLNKNGWLDLIIGLMSHYERGEASFIILYGSPDGYSLENSQRYVGGYSPSRINATDFDGNGNLDLVVSAYSSDVTRILPARLFRGDGHQIDIENPMDILAESACDTVSLDLNRNGYPDVIMACHRNDLGHQVDSLIYWGGPDGISADRTTPLPGLGPHSLTMRDPGHAYTREPFERYISPALDLNGQGPTAINWDADVPATTAIKFDLRWARSKVELDAAPWHGPDGAGTFYATSGTKVPTVPTDVHWMQYRATFVSLYGVASPQLREVKFDLKPR